ncbi:MULTISPECIES: DUF6777 domain-containing protein [unclassified Pseudonocardia]|uniref:DUF6777 domain-containing protein n=1 Tax=unclassified Pseudonocardia TaxID=2619320 RepID=UPI00067FCC20|nr:DUF6777 domain-containing protein [Pseudonocardia sp. Ae707_Ps1]OLM19285.1 hypothetical protein Ae707Ps1_3544 [Pseudonocardia sp. Ae707_Ps1]
MTRPMPPQHRPHPGPALFHHPYPAAGPRRRGVPTWAVLVVAAALALTVAGALFVSLAGPAYAQVVREPVGTAGANPFMPAVGADATGVVAPAGSGGSVAGDTAGLYGGTRSDGTCDAASLTGYLRDDPGKATAWAGALGLGTSQIDGYVAGLTPVVLRADTLVTNHGYVNGVATPFPSVLQAGTAVFVDRWGVPVVRCSCGNPLSAAPTFYGAVYTGPTWVSFSETNVSVVLTSSVEIRNYTLVDPWRHRPFSRPATSHGDRDGDAAVPAPGGSGSTPPAGNGTSPAPGTPGTPGTDTATEAGTDTGTEAGTGSTTPFDPADGTHTVPCGTVTLSGGRGSASDGSPAELAAVTTGDVDGDGRAETAVLLECGSGDATQQSVQLLDDTGSVLAELPVPAPPTGSTGTPEFDASSFALGTGSLTTGVRVFEATDTATGGPTGSQTWTWTWSGGGFVLDGSTVQPVETPIGLTDVPGTVVPDATGDPSAEYPVTESSDAVTPAPSSATGTAGN